MITRSPGVLCADDLSGLLLDMFIILYPSTQNIGFVKVWKKSGLSNETAENATKDVYRIVY